MSDNLFSQDPEALYKVKLKEFEGPLDLLIHLIKSSEINIYDISIAEITHQYLSYLELLVSLDLENISEFIEMAATLIYIKSRTLLPTEVDFDEEVEETRDGLIEKLLEYQKYKMAAGMLDERGDETNIVERKHNKDIFASDDDESNWEQLSIIDLLSAFASVLNKKEKKVHDYRVRQLEFTVEEKIDFISSYLLSKKSINYFDIINNSMPKMELICTFLAILELTKRGMLTVRQHKIFGDINIFLREDYKPYEQPRLGE